MPRLRVYPVSKAGPLLLSWTTVPVSVRSCCSSRPTLCLCSVNWPSAFSVIPKFFSQWLFLNPTSSNTRTQISYHKSPSWGLVPCAKIPSWNQQFRSSYWTSLILTVSPTCFHLQVEWSGHPASNMCWSVLLLLTSSRYLELPPPHLWHAHCQLPHPSNEPSLFPELSKLLYATVVTKGPASTFFILLNFSQMVLFSR